MKLYLEKGELVLPNDFSFEITHANPFFSNEGASSAPATIPPLNFNFELLGHPEDTHKLTRPVREFDATLSAGLFFAKCKIVLDSASRKEGTSISIALKESVMYAELQDKKLPELFAGKIENLNVRLWDIYHGDREFPWITPGEDPYIEEAAIPVCVFPVASDEDEESVFIINEPNAQGTNFTGSVARTIQIGDDQVEVPARYGVEPFLYLWALIEETFKLCGYTVTYNVFKETSPLKDIVVLHNAVDTNLVRYSNNKVNYSMVVPDITVGDLINWLRDKFGAVVCAENGEVSIRLFKDLVTQAYDMDLSGYARDEVSVSAAEPKRLEISADTGIVSAAPAADSLEDLIAAYENRAEVDDMSEMVGEGLFYYKALGKYYYKEDSSSTPVLVGTDAFKYARPVKDVSVEELKGDDLFVPQILVNGRYLPYIGSSVRRITDCAGDRDENYSQKIMICYAPFNETKGCYAASSYGYDEDGNPLDGYPALTPESLYSQYWQKYQEIILNGCPEISCSFDIPVNDLLSLDIATPKRFNGDLVLIKELQFSIDDKGISACEMVMQQIATFEDAVEIPALRISGSLCWERVSTRDPNIYTHGTTYDGISILEFDGLTDYTAADAPAQIPTRPGVITMKRKRWIRYRKYWSYYKWFLDQAHGSYDTCHYYEEYFISTFHGQ
ncbi:MAG: hypothetical protein IJU69_00215 [Bacteroidales bacterium]|nr:hypothetical protein [Bacteroidales bacterium]